MPILLFASKKYASPGIIPLIAEEIQMPNISPGETAMGLN